MSEKNELPPVEIPLEVLSVEALNGVMDNFINREGTDYGLVEVSYEKKIEKIKQKLLRFSFFRAFRVFRWQNSYSTIKIE